jgi:hypothetical protein
LTPRDSITFFGEDVIVAGAPRTYVRIGDFDRITQGAVALFRRTGATFADHTKHLIPYPRSEYNITDDFELYENPDEFYGARFGAGVAASR